MLATERQRRVLEHLREHGNASVQELAALVDCSEPTLRRDLFALDTQGLIQRSRGGAAFPSSGHLSSPPPNATDDAWSNLARLGAALVKDGETIALGGGPLIAQLAAHLADRKNLSVVTNSLLVSDALAESDVDVIVAGGLLRGAAMNLVGSRAERIFSEFGARRAFVSGDGLTSKWGLSCADAASASVEQVMASSAQEVAVIIDGGAVGTDAMSLTVPRNRIDDVVTDGNASEAILDELRESGVRVHIVRPHTGGER